MRRPARRSTTDFNGDRSHSGAPLMTSIDRVVPQATSASLPRVGVSLPLMAALVTLAIGLRSRTVLGDPDTWSHVAVGRWILEHRTVPASDPFSHSVPGIGWTAHEWGS